MSYRQTELLPPDPAGALAERRRRQAFAAEMREAHRGEAHRARRRAARLAAASHRLPAGELRAALMAAATAAGQAARWHDSEAAAWRE